MKWRKPDTPMMEKRFSFIKKYFLSYKKRTIEIAGLSKGDTVLDFGCETQELKKLLPRGINYVGYDVDEKYSSVKDYTKVKANVVIANHVLEHLTMEQLQEFIVNVKKIKPKLLIVSLPLDGIFIGSFKRFAAIFIGGGYFRHDIEHLTEWRKICNELYKNFECEAVETIFFMTLITAWKVK